MRRFLLIFAILFLAPIIGHAATCTSTETVTKCAKISTTYYKFDYEVLSDTEYIIYYSTDEYGYRVPVHGIATETACTLTTAPFERGSLMPPVASEETAAQSCAGGAFSTIYNITASETDICPDGFFTMPYDVSCGAGMVDTANVPNCSDDTSGESCLIPATSAPAPEYKFTATIDLSRYSDNIYGFGMPVTEFGFNLGAAGTFYVDWGDGTTETIKKDNTDAVTYTHDYGTTSGTYTVKIGGLATDYSDNEYTSAIYFYLDVSASSAYSQAITEISGSLGAIFPTLSDGSQPRFLDLFEEACFAEIPSGLFDGIHGAPVSNMFFEAFAYNDNLAGIPENLFSGITGAAEGMFAGTFYFCSKLTGPSARINGKYLYDLWPDNITKWGGFMYEGATGLSDYACIPTLMGGGGETCEPAPEVLCAIGISQIKISTGMSFALYAEKYTQPSLAIKYNDGICYGKLEQGNQSGTMNFNYNGTVYHLAN